ncbi:MAG: thymidine kinase [Candidatus Hodarchaeota archaeon]
MPSIYIPGYLEVIFGPMKSGKSERLINFFNTLKYSEIKGIVFKPAVNTREENIATRAYDIDLEAIAIDEKNPNTILHYLEDEDFKFIGIDEAHMFDINLVEVIDSLLLKDYHIIVCGLILSFRGEPFGPMPWLIGRAHKITRLTAICEYPGCNRQATRSQRLINGDPAPYNSPLLLIENSSSNEKYEARCCFHHIVPK